MIQGTGMDIFVHHQNLEHYRRLLGEPDVANDLLHKSLIRLLANEEAREMKSP